MSEIMGQRTIQETEKQARMRKIHEDKLRDEAIKNMEDEQKYMRTFVVGRELQARANKAEWEKMHFYLECRKLSAEYEEALREDRKKMEEQAKLEAELRQKLEQQFAENIVSNAAPEESPVDSGGNEISLDDLVAEKQAELN